MAAWRAVAAGSAAFLTSMVLELGALAALGGEGRWPVMPVVVAPMAEELMKRLFLWPLSAGWAMTGLAFGVIEGLLKTAEWHALGLLGAVASVLQHWAYGRWAERGGLWLALALHMGFNATVLAVDHATDARAAWAAPLLAAGLLLVSFRDRRRGGGNEDVDAAPPAP